MKDKNEKDEQSFVLDKLFLKRKDIKEELKRIEKDIFRNETICLDVSQGSSVMKSLEFYSSNRSDRKKYVIQDSDRIFSKDLPQINKKNN
ncbi:subunit 4 of histone acetyltransferase [Tubulinosema ratisbonensis]|uniref:Chromatin modification-related protein EAF6 n=1 Tax=Tubulinosema ratisbonensis TaxID=291195 RepID=A0A437AQC9_9MICR|nr:subunit 4 of histone acetyltransferase [Tubulinosema ratisbonensis]